MCGIGGFINFNLNCKLNEDSLRKISKSIRHRGPDDNGDFFTGQVGLCNRRLSIQDLSKNASMPIFDKINGLVLTYNGEIYNFKELKKTFKKRIPI